MDLVERIENTRYLGREFVVWLWYKSELLEATFTRPSGDVLELWFDSQLAMRSVYEPTEQVAFKGVAPAGRVEAKIALQHAWLPVKVRVCITADAKDFAFVLESDTLAKTTVKLPALIAEDSDERFFERMQLLELVDVLVQEQYAEFLHLRQSKLWDAELVPAMIAWTLGEERLSAKAYKGLVQRASR
jgi:hypothetical protein